MAQKNYVDLEGLRTFLGQIRSAYSGNDLTGNFTVQYAQNAKGDGSGNEISATYATKATTIAGVDLQDNITKAELLTALNVADGAQVNVVEGLQLKGSKAESFSDVSIDTASKKIQLDLSGYALLTDVESAVTSLFKFKGIVATVADLPSSGNKEGDVYHVTADDGEYVWINSGDGEEGAHWELLSHNLSNYYTKNETYSKTEIDTVTGTLQSNIDAIYKAASGSVAESGVLVTKLAALNGSGSGDYITGVSQTNGKISVTTGTKGEIASGNTGLVDGGKVYTAIDTAVKALDASEVGGAGSYISTISETDGVISATAGTKGLIEAGNLNLVDGATVKAYVDSQVSGGNIDIAEVDLGDDGVTNEGLFQWKKGDGDYVEVDTHSQINRIETIQVKQIGASSADAALSISSKNVVLDLNTYFGSVTTAEINGLFS